MPNLDKSGPNGQGSMSGRQLGLCGCNAIGVATMEERAMCGQGRGRRRGRGQGRGNGQGNGQGRGRGRRGQGFMQTANTGTSKKWYSFLTQIFTKKRVK